MQFLLLPLTLVISQGVVGQTYSPTHSRNRHVVPRVVHEQPRHFVHVAPRVSTKTSASGSSATSSVRQPGKAGATVSTSRALAALNSKRARRGLYPLIEDPQLTAVAEQRLQMNLRRGNWRHYIRNGRFVGSLGGAAREGCGLASSPDRFIACEEFTTAHRYAGAAMAPGPGGNFCLLLVR
jgi:hypothetical protein